MSSKYPSTSDPILDSRDIIVRISELTSERDALQDAVDLADPDDTVAHGVAVAELEDWNSEEGQELAALESLAEEGEGCSDWEHGAQLVRDDYFEDHARELAEELGLIPQDTQWPCTCIDWNQAADELRQDYTSIDFAGTTYWVRS